MVGIGKGLLGQAPSDASAITSRIAALEEMWHALGLRSTDKAQKLQEASEQQQYNRGVEDVEFWLAESEALLAANDLGRDLGSVQSLIKKHAVVEADVAAHRDRIDGIASQAQAFRQAGHFDADAIAGKQEAVVARFRVLQSRAGERRDELAASLRLQQLYRDMDDEVAWIKEKSRIAQSSDFGKDLTGVQNLQKKHQTFTAELAAHQARIDDVLKGARALIADKHYAAADVDARQKELQQKWTHLLVRSMARLLNWTLQYLFFDLLVYGVDFCYCLCYCLCVCVGVLTCQDASDSRKRKLDESLAGQMFSADADEEESWLHEKIAMATATESPDTLASAQALLKKHDAFENDLSDHSERIAAVCQHGASLVAKGNYQSEIITQATSKLQSLQQRLREASAARKVALTDRCTSLQFSREADSILAWIADKEPLMASDDFGRDLPAVQALLARQASFDSALVTFEVRINALAALKNDLLRQSNSGGAAIAQADAVVSARWKKLLAAAESRKVCMLSLLTADMLVLSWISMFSFHLHLPP